MVAKGTNINSNRKQKKPWSKDAQHRHGSTLCEPNTRFRHPDYRYLSIDVHLPILWPILIATLWQDEKFRVTFKNNE